MKQYLPLILGFSFLILACWNYLQPNFFHLHDFTHVARLVELERSVIEGQIPPRWSANLGYGYGLPQFSFYGNLFYFLALLIRQSGLDYLWSVKLGVISLILINYWSVYSLGRILRDRWMGMLMATASIFTTYRFVGMYVRGALAELTAITCLSLTVTTIVFWAKKPNVSRAAIMGIAGAGLLLSHYLIALISTPFILIWLAFWATREKLLRKHWVGLVIAGLLAFGLSAVYVVPAMWEKNFTQVEKLTGGFSNYSQHFLYIRQLWNSKWGYGGSIWGAEDNISFEVGKLQLVLIAVIGSFTLRRWAIHRRHTDDSIVVVSTCIILLSLFMAILKSKFIWDNLEWLKYVQFPWRFLSVSIVFLPIPLLGLKQLIPKKIQPQVYVALAILMVVAQINHVRPEKFLGDSSVLYYDDAKRIQTHMSQIIPDFLPRAATPEKIASFSNQGKFQFDISLIPTVEVNRGHEFLIATDGKPFSKLVLGIFDFPGWTVYFDGKKVEHITTREGLIEVTTNNQSLPNFISGRFEETPIRLGSDIVTLCSIILAGGLLWKPKK